LYGTSKFCAERLALEYGSAFGFPVWINRCGVLAGAGQFGKADQGIFSFWIHSWASKKPLRYLGFGGHGHQVRDCLHPEDLVPVLLKQAAAGKTNAAGLVPQVANLSGGIQSARSLLELSQWCADRFGPHPVCADSQERPFDLPWVVLDSTLAQKTWGWYPSRNLDSILEEIASHAESNPRWLDLCG
jgi:CDP-paratose 2-epimerase